MLPCPKQPDWRKPDLPLLIGSGGGTGKGGSSGDTAGSPTSDPDTLASRQDARVIDVWTEGPIEGFVHSDFPFLDILLDGTPIQNNNAAAIRADGKTINGSTVFTIPTSTPVADRFKVFKKSDGTIKPLRSPWVGRWINEA